MNVCFMFFSFGVWGGAETAVHEVAKHVGDRGVGLSIVLNQEVVSYFDDIENINIYNVGPLYGSKGLAGRNLVGRLFLAPSFIWKDVWRYRYLRKIMPTIVQYLDKNNVDVVISSLEVGVPLLGDMSKMLKAHNIATVAWLTGEPYLRGAQPVSISSRPYMKWVASVFKKALSKVDFVTSPSAYTINDWKRAGASFNKSEVTHSAVDVAEIQKEFHPISKTGNSFSILFPGGARFVKGGDLLIRSLPKVKKEIPDIHVFVALDVPQGHMLRQMVKKLQLENNVTFAGFLPIQQYRKLLNSVDLLVLPSRDDSFPITCVEAMALGKPVIAADRGGIPEMIKNGRNGILVDLDPNPIADAILKLYHDPALRNQMGQNNLVDANNFDWNRVADQYVRIFKELSARKIDL
jgi:glycosyltransferase involved in cell wall biosynthesis